MRNFFFSFLFWMNKIRQTRFLFIYLFFHFLQIDWVDFAGLEQRCGLKASDLKILKGKKRWKEELCKFYSPSPQIPSKSKNIVDGFCK